MCGIRVVFFIGLFGIDAFLYVLLSVKSNHSKPSDFGCNSLLCKMNGGEPNFNALVCDTNVENLSDIAGKIN
jgi:hypothetical protein